MDKPGGDKPSGEQAQRDSFVRERGRATRQFRRRPFSPRPFATSRPLSARPSGGDPRGGRPSSGQAGRRQAGSSEGQDRSSAVSRHGRRSAAETVFSQAIFKIWAERKTQRQAGRRGTGAVHPKDQHHGSSRPNHLRNQGLTASHAAIVGAALAAVAADDWHCQRRDNRNAAA